MDEAAIIQYLNDTFEDLQTVATQGHSFFFRGAERNFPLATLVTNDEYDSASDLNRPSVFRLNIGVSKSTYAALFTSAASPAGADEAGPDFTVLDQIMPHPVYGKMFWICVLNPSATTFETVRPLLAEAYERAAVRQG